MWYIIIARGKERPRKKGKVREMTTKEIKERIEQIKEKLFMLNMIDRQTSEDRERISNLKNELNEMEMALA